MLEHRFGNDWVIKLGLMAEQTKVDLLATSIWSGDRNLWAQKMSQQETGVDLYASGPFELLGRQHELVVGASRRRLNYALYDMAFQDLGAVDPYLWTPSSLPKPTYVIDPSKDTQITTQNSLYATGRFKLTNELKVIVGGRLDWFDFSDQDDTGSASGYKISQNLTRYAGIIYDLNKQHSLYASYTDIFKPQSEHQVNGSTLKPIVGTNYEIGVKGEYFGGALNASVAVFQIDQTNRARELTDQSVCPTYPNTYCYEAAGLVRSKGIDLEVEGALTPNWQIGAGWTYSHAKYINDAVSSNIGKTFNTQVPLELFKLSTMYHLMGAWNKWRIGANVYQQSRIYYADESSHVYTSQKAYSITGLVAGYRASAALDFQLNVNNIFDKKYYQSIASGAYYPYDIYGSPRNVQLTAKYLF